MMGDGHERFTEKGKKWGRDLARNGGVEGWPPPDAMCWKRGRGVLRRGRDVPQDPAESAGSPEWDCGRTR